MADLDDSITRLYHLMCEGDKSAEQRLFEIIAGELHELAGHILARERPDPNVTVRGLVDEVYIRLAKSLPQVQDRNHLLNLLGMAMRQIYREWGRHRLAARRSAPVTPLDTANQRMADVFKEKEKHHVSAEEILAVDEALSTLARRDPNGVRILELKFFAGYSIEEIADKLDRPKASVFREYQKAKGKLARILESSDNQPPRNF